GSNGSGKTTLLKMLSGMIRPTKGRITFGDKDIWDDIDEFRKKVGVVFEEPMLFSDATLLENLRFVMTLYGCTNVEAHIEKWVNEFKLSHQLHEPFKYLSRGERQKASLIRAFAPDPELLIFDEPLTSLDIESRQMILNAFENSTQTLVVSSHEPMIFSKRNAVTIDMNHERVRL
ncbi:MAG: ABC transporter ATP-binding protein, partial [Bdellovibrionales bacterium]|nr:ABC transporter ATP-binding protein [Bdellovibrionales bacterium]